jgi:hypothetical protein
MPSKETLEQFSSCWEGLDEPRSGNAALHDLHELLMIALCCVLCGAVRVRWTWLFRRGEGAISAQLSHPGQRHAPPRHIQLADPQSGPGSISRFHSSAYGAVFRAVEGGRGHRRQGLGRSFDRASGKSVLHMVSAWGSERRIMPVSVSSRCRDGL